ncbi:SDR family oxidoreductase [Proteiniclasticum sp. C24MP]|uniref:SDR family oxidoreductase n=1 Tax=Proteiniclasticum sp. C24MP TaxID=3374101 RepID=UPI003754E24F
MKYELKDHDMPRDEEIRDQNMDSVDESEMDPEPIYDNPTHKGYGRLKDKVAIVTGGDSGIGRAISVAFAKEGADVVIIYYDSNDDADKTKKIIEDYGSKCILLKGDLGKSGFSREIIEKTLREFGSLDIIVNNAAEQHPQNSLEEITDDQLERTFRTNIFSMFYLIREALPHLKEGASIINTNSNTSFVGNPRLIDYSATKGAISSFTRSLSLNLASRRIRVNQVAPGPIWTPLIPSTFSGEDVENFGKNVPLARPGQPVELAEAYVYLASDGSTYMTGQTLHVNGGEILNG